MNYLNILMKNFSFYVEAVHRRCSAKCAFFGPCCTFTRWQI